MSYKKSRILSQFIILLIFSYANIESREADTEEEIQLFLENIEINSIQYQNICDIKIDCDPEKTVMIEKQNNKVYIKSNNEIIKIDLILPEKSTYMYTFKNADNDSYCKFSMQKFYLYQNEKLVVQYKNNVLLIEDDTNNSRIKIDKNKTEIKNEDGSITEISSDGIISSDKDKDDQYNGFWGKIIGNALQFGINLAMEKIAETPADMAKVFINTDLNEIK